MTINPQTPPPVGGMGGSIVAWERGLDSWHRDAFPDPFKEHAPNQGERRAGWIALDWISNAIGFVADGTEVEP